MAFFWRHKIFSLFIFALAFYLYINPAGRFGIARKGIVVYNRIPVLLFDLYIGPDGKLTLEDDLSSSVNVNHWLKNHVNVKNIGAQNILLFVGTGFDSTVLTLDRQVVSTLHNMRMSVRQLPSAHAVSEYNRANESGKPVAILLKVK